MPGTKSRKFATVPEEKTLFFCGTTQHRGRRRGQRRRGAVPRPPCARAGAGGLCPPVAGLAPVQGAAARRSGVCAGSPAPGSRIRRICRRGRGAGGEGGGAAARWDPRPWAGQCARLHPVLSCPCARRAAPPADDALLYTGLYTVPATWLQEPQHREEGQQAGIII